MDSLRRPGLQSAGFVVLALLSLSACAIIQPSSPSPLQAEQPVLSTQSRSLVELVKRIEPAVVRVAVAGPEFTNWGSGFIFDAGGLILTNQHLLSPNSQITVTIIDGDTYPAEIVATDAVRDIAILKIASGLTGFPFLKLGASNNIAVGEEVFCAGFPLGGELPGPATFSRGNISALRELHNLKFIQSDIITINVGSSGSPLMDMDGNVIGVVVAGVLPSSVDAEGIGLAIPIDEVKPLIQKNLSK